MVPDTMCSQAVEIRGLETLWMLKDYMGSKGDWTAQQEKKNPLKGAKHAENTSGSESPRAAKCKGMEEYTRLLRFPMHLFSFRQRILQSRVPKQLLYTSTKSLTK